MRSMFLLPAVLFASLLLVALVAEAPAQTSLGPGITNVQGQFTVEQRDNVESFWEHWSQQMRQAETDHQIAAARRHLVDPLERPGVTVAFRKQYAAIGLSHIRDLIGSDRTMVRLSALIVLAHTRQPLAAEAARASLAAENVAVRYWAAKAIAEGLDDEGGAGLDQAQRTTTRQALVERLGEETVGPVRGQLYLGLARLETTEARLALLDALDANLRRYLEGGITSDLQAEVMALTHLRVALSADRIRSDAVKRRLIVVAGRYLQLMSRAVEHDQVTPETSLPMRNLVNMIDLILNRAVDDFDDSGPRPDLIEPFEDERYGQFRLNASDWILTMGELDLGIDAGAFDLPAVEAEDDPELTPVEAPEEGAAGGTGE